MKLYSTIAALVTALVMSGASFAAETEGPPEGPPRDEFRRQMRELVLKHFDKDGDGKLSDEERAAAREARQEMRGEGIGPREGRGPRGRGQAQQGPEARGPREGIGPPEGRGPRGPRADRGPQGPEGRGLGPDGAQIAPPIGPGPRDPGKVFDKFDADKDGQLSREEFQKLTESIRKRMQAARAGRMGRGPGQGPAQGDWERLHQRRGPGARPGEGPPRLERDGFDGPRGPQGQWQHRRGQGPGPGGEADGPRRPRRAGPPPEEAPPEQAPVDEVPVEEPI